MWRHKTGMSSFGVQQWSLSIFGERSARTGERSLRSRSGVSFFGMRRSLGGAEETYKWQWKHRTGFRDYEDAVSRRIEAVYRRGDPKVRLKTGKTKDVPMEIF